MIARTRNGFTLIELLVVIAIIAMLMGLLLPAVNSARESGRRTTCTNNQGQLAKAIAGYDSAKGHLPGYANQVGAGVGAAPAAVSWVVELLPYLGRTDLWEGPGGNNGWRSGGGVIPSVQLTRLNEVVCPDDDSPTSVATTSPLTYVVNVGNASVGYVPGDVPSCPFVMTADPATENGVIGNCVPISDATIKSPRYVSLSSIKSASQRPLLSESLYPQDLYNYPSMPPDFYSNTEKYMRRWNGVASPSNLGGPFVLADIPANLSAARLGFVWAPTPTWQASYTCALGATVTPTSPTGQWYRCTQAGTSGTTQPTWSGASVTDNSVTWQNIGSTLFSGQSPVSAPFAPAWLPQRMPHPGVVIITFCDGHVQSLADDALCSVYDSTNVTP